MHLRLVGLLMAAVSLAGAPAAKAAASTPPYRSTEQAVRYLEHGLRSWDSVDLRNAEWKSAYCVSTAQEASGSSQTRFRSFACTLDVTAITEKSYVFGIRLVSARRGWQARPMH